MKREGANIGMIASPVVETRLHSKTTGGIVLGWISAIAFIALLGALSGGDAKDQLLQCFALD